MTARPHGTHLLLAAALLGILTGTLAGCGAPAPSHAALTDDDMKKLFPSEAEIKSALGDVGSWSGPKLQAVNPSASFPPNDGMSQECFDAAYGTAETRAKLPTRTFVAAGADPGRIQPTDSMGVRYTWVLTQRASADDLRKSQDAAKDRLSKCSTYEFFDSGTTSGISFATKPSSNGKGPAEGASAVVTSGDVSLAFRVSGASYQQAEELAKKMAPVMEKRLQASTASLQASTASGPDLSAEQQAVESQAKALFSGADPAAGRTVVFTGGEWVWNGCKAGKWEVYPHDAQAEGTVRTWAAPISGCLNQNGADAVLVDVDASSKIVSVNGSTKTVDQLLKR